MSPADLVNSIVDAEAERREREDKERQDRAAREAAVQDWAGRIRAASAVKITGSDLPDPGDLTQRLLQLARAFREPTWWVGRPGDNDPHCPETGILARLKSACGHPGVPPEFQLIASLLIMSATEPDQIQPLVMDIYTRDPDLLNRAFRWLSWVCHNLVLANCAPGTRYGTEGCSTDHCPVPSDHVKVIHEALSGAEQTRPEVGKDNSAGKGVRVYERPGTVRGATLQARTGTAGALPAAATTASPLSTGKDKRRKKGDNLALAIQLKRMNPDWDRKTVAAKVSCDVSLLTSQQYVTVEIEVEAKARADRAKRGEM